MEDMDGTTPATERELVMISKLSNHELELLRERAKKLAMKSCDDVVKPFVECSKTRVISTVWACRSQLQEMNACVMKQYACSISPYNSKFFNLPAPIHLQYSNGPDVYERAKLMYVRYKDQL